MKASVDKELCSSCAVCVDECPEVFELDENDLAFVKVDPIPPDEEAACRESAEACPTEAIIIEQ